MGWKASREIVQSNLLLKAGLTSNVDHVADGLIQSSFGNLPRTEVIHFPWATRSIAYLLSARRICVRVRFPSLDHGTIAICPVSVETSLMFLPGCLFHTEKSYFYLALPSREALLYLLIIFHSSEGVFQSYCIFFSINL